MKARVKATGEIIEISEDCSYIFAEHYDKQYDLRELEFVQGPMRMEIFPDYWTRLEHQAAIAAMQGILSNQDYCKLLIDENNKGSFAEDVSRCASDFAHALMEKYKKEERK